MPTGSLNGVVPGRIRLDDHLPGARSSTGTTGDLRQELEGALGSAEVGQEQPRVGQHHTHQGDSREVEPLSDHLRANQDVGRTGVERSPDPLMGATVVRGIAVPTEQPRAGKVASDFLFDSLGAGAQIADARSRAGRAAHGRLTPAVAVVTQQKA